MRVSYEGDEGKRWFGGSKARSYSDWMVLDLGIYANTRQITRRGMHDIHERLRGIKNLLSKWSATGGGLLALGPDDVNRRFERWEEQQTQQDTSPDIEDEIPPY
ncbi:MAG: hypothetical protein M3P18_10810 [Actinomycetota bacterium]|nr:hypothetical protein [Actinomycetota bacterium]